MQPTIQIIRKVDEIGRLTLPKDLRTELGFHEGEALSITVQDNSLVIRRLTTQCIFCSNEAHVKFRGQLICPTCLKDLKEGRYFESITRQD